MLIEADGQLIHIVGESIQPLHAVERTTAECLAESERRRSMIATFASCFSSRMRLSCHDGASPNPRYERAILRDRGGSWDHWGHVCEAHHIFNGQTKCFNVDLATEAVSAQKAWALSINVYGGMERWQHFGFARLFCRMSESI